MPPNSLATVYADESDDKSRFVIACITIPTLSISGPSSGPTGATVSDDWDRYYKAAKEWRAGLKRDFNIPVGKELKGSKLATGRNQYDEGKRALYGTRAIQAYKAALARLDFLPPSSAFSVCASRSYRMYGHRKLEASLHALLQRLEKQAKSQDALYQLFFDEGHNEYRRLYRKACVHLPTGSALGGWPGGGLSRSLPLQSTIKDANFKDSKFSHFVQIADIVAYATLLKARAERGALSPKEVRLGTGNLHDEIPRSILNTRVVRGGTDGIVRLT